MEVPACAGMTVLQTLFGFSSDGERNMLMFSCD